MLKTIPEIKTKIVNDTLSPYFNDIFKELLSLVGTIRSVRLKQYINYLEGYAQKKTTPNVVCIQIRINIQTLREKLSDIVPLTIDIVSKPRKILLPRFSDEAYYDSIDPSAGFSVTTIP